MPVKKVKSSPKKTALRSPRQFENSSNASTPAARSKTRLGARSPRATLAKNVSHAKSPRASTLTASVYDLKGKAVGRVSLPIEIFGVPENPKLIAQAVRVYLANQRQGNASTKNRGEVQGSTRKIYRQKGTGRARHGGIRAPIFVGGGLAFGPRPHDFSLSLPQKAKRLALFSALSSKLKDNEIKIIAGLEKVQPKTKVMAKILKTLDVNGKTLLITPSGSKDFESVYKSARNIKDIRILPATTLNTYEVLENNKIVLMKDSIEKLKDHFLKTIRTP